MQDEVKQADREAAARAGLELSRLTDRDADALRQGGSWDEWSLVQAFARHRRQAERETLARMEWMDIESAPRDESILAAIKVRHRNVDTWWEQHVIVIDSETGAISDMDYHHGWEADDYQFWMPLPPAPEAGQ